MRWAKWILWSILSLAGLWLTLSWVLAGQFLKFGVVDYAETDEIEILDQLNLVGLQRSSVEIPSDEVVLAGSYFRHPMPNKCAVILLPGIGGSRTQVLPALPIFWALGCHVLAYDPRGTGASSRVQRTFGYLEKKDNAKVVNWLASRTGLAASSIGVWGPSFGAGVGLLTLDEVDGLAFVIADSTFHSFAQVATDTVAQLFGSIAAQILTPGIIYSLQLRTGLDAGEINPDESIVDTLTPVLLIHAKHDPAMYVYHSERVYAARTTNNVALQVTDWGAGHADSALVDPAAYQQLVHEFLGPLGFKVQRLAAKKPQDR